MSIVPGVKSRILVSSPFPAALPQRTMMKFKLVSIVAIAAVGFGGVAFPSVKADGPIEAD